MKQLRLPRSKRTPHKWTAPISFRSFRAGHLFAVCAFVARSWALVLLPLCSLGQGTVVWGQVWSGNALAGGRIQALAIDPATPTTVYAGALGGGVFASADGGANWSALNSGLPASADVRFVRIDPANPSTLYAGAGTDGVFKGPGLALSPAAALTISFPL